MVYPFLVLAVVMMMIYITVELTQKPLYALFIKALASLSFILLGVTRLLFVQSAYPESLGWILLGLACGLIGDIVLALRPLRPKEEDKTIIVLGIISFAMGHLFYLLGLSTIQNLSWMSYGIGIIAMVVVVIMSKVMKFDMGIARMPSYVYAFMIFLMIGQGVFLMTISAQNVAYLIFMIGAILFGISDLILAPIYYTPQSSKMMVVLNLVTYYGAQILIALSLWYM
jgi:uncharacterized membrane protein YhhN